MQFGTIKNDDWCRKMPGLMLIEQEKILLNRWLGAMSQGVVLQIGGAPECDWVNGKHTTVIHATEVPYLFHSQTARVKSNFVRLPIAPNSVDAVLIPHVLAYLDNPLPVLQEACLALKPNGQLIILGLNKTSLWKCYSIFGFQQAFFKDQKFLPGKKIKDTLRRLGMRLAISQTVCFRPPIKNTQLAKHLNFLEMLGQFCFPALGAGLMIVAIKQVAGMTAIPALQAEQEKKWRASAVRQVSRNCHD